MIDKIDAWQVFYSLLLLLGGYISVMITLFRNDLKEIKNSINMKVDRADCKDFRDECEKDCNQSRISRDECIRQVRMDALSETARVKAEFDRKAHIHASVGTAGEVVK